MTPTDLSEIKDRLATHAFTQKDTAPDTILTADGGPSQALMAYRAKHNLTLDWIVTGEGPQHRQTELDLSDVTEGLTFLHALLQGLDILIGEAQDCRKASNAIYALSQEVVAKGDRILGDTETIRRRIGQ